MRERFILLGKCIAESVAVSALVAAIVMLVFMILNDHAEGHDFYTIECCSDKDCGPVADTAVQATPAGWRIVETNEVIEYGSKKIKESPDGRFHWCSRNPEFPPQLRTICLYVPPQLF